DPHPLSLPDALPIAPPVPSHVTVREVPVPDVLRELYVPHRAEAPLIGELLDPTEERRVAQHVRDEDTIAIRVLEVEELEAVGEVCGDRLLEEHVVAVSSDGTTHIEVRRVGRADEDDIGEPGDREQLVDVGKSTLRRDPVPALELRAPRRIRLDHTAEGEAGVVRRDQLGEDAVPPRARTDDDNVPHPGSDIISTGSAPGSPARISRTARVPRRVDQTAAPPTAISREPRAVRPKIRWP